MTNAAHIRPENAQKIAMKNGGATSYLYDNRKGETCAQDFFGKSRKFKAYRFTDAARPATYVKDTTASVQARKDADAKRRADPHRAHTLDTGVILYTSWG